MSTGLRSAICAFMTSMISAGMNQSSPVSSNVSADKLRPTRLSSAVYLLAASLIRLLGMNDA
jgi:hypothetical protein